MSLKSFKKVETNRYELEITIDGEKFSAAVDKAFAKNVKKLSVPGFRKGKAPRSIIDKYYGENAFYEDALNLLYGDAVEEAIAEAGLEYVDDEVDFDLVSIEKTGVEFKVVITVKPEVEIDGYKGLSAERVTPVVSDEEIDAEINRAAEKNSRVITVEDRAAQLDDIAVIDFEGFVDDKAFDGGKGEGHSLTLGSGQFIPGFEEQVVGHNSGDEFDVKVDFPADYQAGELAGKEAIFKVKLVELKNREMPAIDDEFVKDISEFDSLDDYKADLKAKALERKNKAADDSVENALIDQVIELVKAEVPKAMIDKRIDQSVEDFAYRLQMQGMTVENYIKLTGSSVDDFRNGFAPSAERQVKLRLALEKIADIEKIVPTEDELNEEFEKLAKEYGVEIDKVKVAVPEKELIKDISVRKAIDLVKSSAKVSEVAEKTEKISDAEESENNSEETKATPKKATRKATTKKSAEEIKE